MNQRSNTGFIYLSIVRGLLGQIAGTLIGMVLVLLVRLVLGLTVLSSGAATWWGVIPEPVWVGGAVLGVIGFILGTGVTRDWFSLAAGKTTPEHPTDAYSSGVARYLSVSYDHKVIGLQYGVTSLTIFAIAGLFALIFRTELAAPGLQFLKEETYNTIMSLHGIVMIAGILIGVGAMSNFLVPLLIGANDMAFPRLNAFAYWINVPGAILVLSSILLGGFDTGWTGYPPLSVKAPLGMQMFFFGVYVIGLSSILGAINILATTLRMRAPGMHLFRMPIFVWSAFATAIIALTATQLIGLSFQMVMFERLFNMAYFDANRGGDPLLFQHLFWFYSHPAVYIFVLTGLGVISELLPVFARKPLYGYRWVAMSSLGIALVGFTVWAHHMFTSGMPSYLRVPFMYTTMLVAVPTGVKFFSWIATIWRGKLSFETPMLFVLGAISIFLLGGLSGPPNATVATDLHLQDTYWIVGHFHATMFGGYLFPFIAAIYYWFPKFTGRMYNERLGKVHFWMMLLGFYVQSLGQMNIGLLGMRRRIADYDPALGITAGQLLITIAGFVIGISILIFFTNLVVSAIRGRVAERNPWRSRSPEWQLPSPLPLHNYENQPVIVGEPYDYGLEGSTYVDMQPRPASPEPAPAD
jgi:cytochrome c oxidase subunit 1